MSDLCQDINLPENTECHGDWANRPINELLKRQIELYEQFNPDYEFDRLEMKWHDGIWVAEPVYKHRLVQRPEDLKDKSHEFRSQNIV